MKEDLKSILGMLKDSFKMEPIKTVGFTTLIILSFPIMFIVALVFPAYLSRLRFRQELELQKLQYESTRRLEILKDVIDRELKR